MVLHPVGDDLLNDSSETYNSFRDDLRRNGQEDYVGEIGLAERIVNDESDAA